jgi:hypothetical protein
MTSMFRFAALALSAALVAVPAWAEKPDGAGGGKGKEKAEKHQGKGQGGPKHEAKAHGGDKHEAKAHDKAQKQQAKAKAKDTRAADVKVGAYFTDQQRSSVRTYYTSHYGGAKSCPPGLAKKNNGCMPPGQAKKWAVGQPLPAGVVLYPVPHQVLVTLPPAPMGHKYVRVATDILLIAVGSQMVIDGISDLMRM